MGTSPSSHAWMGLLGWSPYWLTCIPTTAFLQHTAPWAAKLEFDPARMLGLQLGRGTATHGSLAHLCTPELALGRSAPQSVTMDDGLPALVPAHTTSTVGRQPRNGLGTAFLKSAPECTQTIERNKNKLVVVDVYTGGCLLHSRLEEASRTNGAECFLCSCAAPWTRGGMLSLFALV